jgi:hypothetical protein
MSAIEDNQQQPDSGTRTEAVRESNDRIASRAVELRFTSRVPMLCECHDPGCRAIVAVSLEDFHALRAHGGVILAERHFSGRLESA